MLKRRNTAEKVRKDLRSCLRELRQLPASVERDEAYSCVANAIVWTKELER